MTCTWTAVGTVNRLNRRSKEFLRWMLSKCRVGQDDLTPDFGRGVAGVNDDRPGQHFAAVNRLPGLHQVEEVGHGLEVLPVGRQLRRLPVRSRSCSVHTCIDRRGVAGTQVMPAPPSAPYTVT